MKNKILIFLVALFVLLSGSITSINALDNGKQALDNVQQDDYDMFEDEEYLERNWARVELATKIQTTLNDYYNIKDIYNDYYPTYFGGMYVSDDARNLIVQIVKENIPPVESKDFDIYNKIINMDESVKVEYVNYTFNELNNINNYVSDNLFTDESIDNNVAGTYLDIMDNSVNIELTKNNILEQLNIKNTLAKTKGNLNLNAIKFSTAQKPITFKDINAGEMFLLVANKAPFCSMGMRVRYNGNDGYLTAGHCATGLKNFTTGTIEVAQYANNEKYDYAFVKTSSSYTPTNFLYKYDNLPSNITKLGLINYSPVIADNMAISKAGATTKYTTGKVTGLNYTAHYDKGTTLIKGLIKTDAYASGGDSGGVVMIPRTDDNGGAIGIGIISGGPLNEVGMFFTDLSSIPVALQKRY